MNRRPEMASELETLDDAATLPRDNGEIVFTRPWEARAFGMTVAMYEGGHFEWDSFRQRLIAEVGDGEPDAGSAYYEHWFAAFESLVVSHGILDEDAIRSRMQEIAAEDAHEGGHLAHDHQH